MWTEKILEDITCALKRKGALFINDKGKKFENLHDFLYNFFMIFNHDYPTTFSDGTVQCKAGRNRSIEDIFRICLPYFPDITIKELIKELHNPIWFEGFKNTVADSNHIITLYCNNIKKEIYNIRFHNREYHSLGRDDRDEYGFTNDDILQIIKS